MLRLLAKACLMLLATGASAQRCLYCDTNSPVAVTDRDFYLVTRPSGATSYSQGLTCEFSAAAEAAFLVEVESVRLGTAVLTISSGGQLLFSGSNVPAHQSSMVTPSKSLSVRFDATGEHSSNMAGVKIRVRVLDANGCPSGWSYLLGNCYGTSSTSGLLNYFSAQTACNSMRSNLLEVPASYQDKIRDFVSMLPSDLTYTNTWVGLTDRASQYSHYWLSGAHQRSTSVISCISRRFTCDSNERCGTINDRYFLYVIFMGDCDTSYRFACSMPPGGAPINYTVPWRRDGVFGAETGWIWGAVIGSVLGFCCIFFIIYGGVRFFRARRAARANSGVVPPSGAYPMQPPFTQPSHSAASPPTYDAATVSNSGGGHGNVNAGYTKRELN